MAAVRDNAWVGIDVGKTHHWVCAVDADGKTLLSVKVANDEAAILSLIAAVTALTQQLTWAVDIIGAPSALLLALLAHACQPVHYASGRVVAAMSAAYVGEGKTDAKDAYVIAELPDNESAAAVAISVNASGGAVTKTTVLLTPEEVDAAAQKSVGYRAPGT